LIDYFCGDAPGWWQARDLQPLRAMSTRLWVALAVGASLSSGCGAGSSSNPALAPSAPAGSLRGATVNAIDGQPIAGITVKVGSQSAVSDATGSFHFENVPGGGQSAILSASSVVERRTVMSAGEGVIPETLIPSDFDLQSFDQMFRGSGRLERWTSPPALVVVTTVMTYESAFSDSQRYHATSEQLTDEETALLISQMTDALAALTGNAFTSFASVEREAASSGALVNTMRPGQIVVGRYKGIQGLLNTIGFGRWATDDSGQVTAGAVFLDRDFDKTSDQRRLLRTHELGHALGYHHVTSRTSIMNPAVGPEMSTFDKQGAVIAFRRDPGNVTPDSDPSAIAGHSTTGSTFFVRQSPPF
jgi:hypothetical protein